MGGLIALCAVLGAACLVLIALRLRDDRRARRMARQAEDFSLEGGEGKPLPVATDEGPLARVQNAVSDLETRVLLSEERRREESLRCANLTADISHQLKTPLSALRLYCEMDQGPHAVAEMEQIERMERLIRALLRLEKLSADGYEFRFAERDARAVAEEAWQALAPSWPEKRVEFTGEARVRCDAAWLGEAVGNLLKNACEHTAPAGRVRVCVERADSAVFLTVEDDGGGVPPEELIRLFERFYRAADDPGGGSGLGLAIAREIVRRHHGTIQAENAARGLRVTVSLPVLNLAKT